MIVLGVSRARLARLPLPPRWRDGLAAAVAEEEAELSEVIHPPHGRGTPDGRRRPPKACRGNRLPADRGAKVGFLGDPALANLKVP